MVDRIRELCVKNQTSFKNLEKQLGFANGSIAKLSTVGDKIQAGRLKAIADYFNVSMEYLLSGENSIEIPDVAIEASKKISEISEKLSKYHFNPTLKIENSKSDNTIMEIIHIFYNINEQGQDKLLDYARDLAGLDKYIKNDESAMVQGE